MKTSLLLMMTLSTAWTYNILCIFPVPSRSHNLLGKGIVDALLKAGHEVTWITPFPEILGKDLPKSLKVIDGSATRKYMTAVDMTKKNATSGGIAIVKEYSQNFTKEIIASPHFREAFTKTQFDAVITEAFFSDINAGFAAVQQVPWILMTAVPPMPQVQAQVDEVRSVTTVPLMFNDCTIPMAFWNRLFNTLLYIAMSALDWLDRTPTNNLYKTLFGPLVKARGVNLPPFNDAFYNVSILLVNSHESIAPAFSLPPNAVNIAGYHIGEEIPPLPKDLQDLLDKSPQGVVYFSMGSVLRSSALPESTRLALLKEFAALNQTVLWKFEEKIEALPRNVHVRNWMPQPSILAHPNVRVFITHGGILSTMEAVNAGVPLLAVPVFGDQPANAERAVRAGYARRVTFSEEMAEEVGEQLMEMLSNDSYSKTVKFLSKLFRTRPVPPAKLIPHYVELAIETKGAYHLRSLSQQYPWYQRWMLDQAVFFVVVLAILAELFRIAIGVCDRKLTGSQKNVVKQKNN